MAGRSSNKDEKVTSLKLFRGKYAPEYFLIPGQDQNGNSVRVHCRVTPLLDRAIEVLWGSKRFPFRAKGDLIRWAIKVGVDRLEEMEPVVGDVIIQAEAMNAILRAEDQNHAFMTIFNTMTVTIGAHVQAQAIGEARRVVAMIRAQIMKIDNDYWRDRYLKELESKFGYLISSTTTSGANIGQHVDSGPGIDEGDDEL